MAGQHARLSPSGADRWMLCPGSTRLEEGLPNTSSKFADEGTAAHFLASECLIGDLNAHVHLGHTINICVEIATGNEVCLWDSRNFKDYEHRTSFVVDAEMVQYIQAYLGVCRAHAEEGDSFTEVALDISHLTSEEGAKGTVDFHVVKEKELVIIDLKYGRTPVQARDNRQLMMYALAAYREYGLVQDFDTFRLVISQPRVFDDPSEHVITLDELIEFSDEVEDASIRAWSVFTEGDGSVADKDLNPGEAQCKYCKAKLTCQKFGQETNAVVLDQFDMIDAAADMSTPAAVTGQIDQLIGSYTPEYLNDMANKVGLVKQWCKAVEDARDHYLLEQNGQLADWKVVQGNEGPRSWVNDMAVEAEMKRMKIREEHIYSKKVITAPQAEKLFKAKILGAKQWPKLQELIVRKPGGKTVVPVTDKRPALTHVADQFDLVGYEELPEGVPTAVVVEKVVLKAVVVDEEVSTFTDKDWAKLESKQAPKAAEVNIDDFM
jgi:hypothetical protein